MTNKKFRRLKRLVHLMDHETLKREGWNLFPTFFYWGTEDWQQWSTYVARTTEIERSKYSRSKEEYIPSFLNLYRNQSNGYFIIHDWDKLKGCYEPPAGDSDLELCFYLVKGDVMIFFNRKVNKFYKFIDQFFNAYETLGVQEYTYYDSMVAVRWLGAYWTGAGSADTFEESLRYETSLKDREVSAQGIYHSEDSHWIDNLERKSKDNLEKGIHSTLERCKVGILYYQPEIRVVYYGDAYTFQIGSILSSKRDSYYYYSDEQSQSWESSFDNWRAYDEAVLYKEAYPAAIVVRDKLLPENWEVVKRVAEEKGLPIYHVKGKSFFKKQLGIED